MHEHASIHVETVCTCEPGSSRATQGEKNRSKKQCILEQRIVLRATQRTNKKRRRRRRTSTQHSNRRARKAGGQQTESTASSSTNHKGEHAHAKEKRKGGTQAQTQTRRNVQRTHTGHSQELSKSSTFDF
mmetsp:Transcript_150896/g.262206  ORF Transcript_150896/g.262206 Transcript_150896/m.262206 type:complete len:130 (-) Transcript_150896:209-598(-)